MLGASKNRSIILFQNSNILDAMQRSITSKLMWDMERDDEVRPICNLAMLALSLFCYQQTHTHSLWSHELMWNTNMKSLQEAWDIWLLLHESELLPQN